MNFITAISFFTICLFGYAQNPNIKFYRINKEQGLSQSVVTSITQDSDGFMWFGTITGGLNRYDGYRCKNYLPSNNKNSIHSVNIRTLHGASNGMLWIGFEDGKIQTLNPKTGNFIRMDSIGGNDEWFITPPWNIIEDDIGRIYLHLENNNVIRYHTIKNKWQQLIDPINFPKNNIGHLSRDQQGNVFFALDDTLIDLYKTANLKPKKDFSGTIFLTPNSLKKRDIKNISSKVLNEFLDKKIESKFFHSFFQDVENTLWTFEKENLLHYTGHTIDTVFFSNQLGKPNSSHYRLMYQSKDGTIWGKYKDGVIYFNPCTPFNIIGKKQEKAYRIHSESIRCISENPFIPGEFWISGYNKQRTEKYLLGKGGDPHTPNCFNAILPYNEEMFVVAKDVRGFAFYYPYENIKHENLNFKQKNWLKRNPFIKGRYVNSNGKVFVKFENLRVRTSNSVVKNGYDLIRDENNLIWGSADNGIFLLDTINLKWKYTIYHKEIQAFSNAVYCLEPDSNNVVWGGMQKKIVWVDLQEKKSGEIELPIENSSIINDLFFDSKGILWAATSSSGLLKIKIEKNRGKFNAHVKTLTTQDGMPSNIICGILEDGLGRKWCSTNNGLVVIDKKEVIPINSNFGLQNDEFNRYAFTSDSQGNFFFGGIRGITFFKPDSIQFKNDFPNVLLTDILIMGDLQENKFLHQRPINLKPDQKNITLFFSSLQYRRGNDIRYQYTIKEKGDKWLDLGIENKLAFNELSSGRYTLLIRCTDIYGRWSNKHLKIELNVLPYWHETYWFKSILIIIGVLIVFTITWVWVRRTRNANLRLERIVKERTEDLSNRLKEREVMLSEIHHRVKNNLQMISSVLNLQLKQSNDKNVKKELQIGRSRVQAIAELHKSLYQQENLGAIDMETYLEKLIDINSDILLNKSFILEKKISVVHFTPNVKTAVILGLICNEAITNSMKYAFNNRSSGKILISLKSDGTKVQFEIKDNGPGFDPKKDYPGSIGLTLIRELVSQLKGTYSFDFEDGTTLIINFTTSDGKE